jgi:tRNA threonylcarbamoyladenosine biosynthesis protein TsaB
VQHQRSSSVLLCIETSGSLCGVALADATSEQILAELSFSEPFLHDKLLAEAVHSLMKMTEISFADITAVAVSSGPGSFTGLRIGAAFAKALCFDDSPKLLPVPTMHAYALHALNTAYTLGKTDICVGIPSHRDLVYLQHFGFRDASEIIAMDDITLVKEEAVHVRTRTLYVGGAFLHKPDFMSLPELCCITPTMIAAMAMRRFKQEQFVASEDFVPLYSQEFTPKIAVISSHEFKP